MHFRDELPADHRLARIYRWGAAACGVILVVFGGLGLAGRLSPFDTHDGMTIAGLGTNGLLSVVSLAFGALLIAGALIGGNTASTVNLAVGVLFLLSGFVHLALLGRSANILGFGMANVLFSFAMGLLVVVFGMYGRVSGRLPHDNPYWRHRHPEEAAREEAAREEAAREEAARRRSPRRTPAVGIAPLRGSTAAVAPARGQRAVDPGPGAGT